MKTLEDLIDSAREIVTAVSDFNLAIGDLELVNPWSIDSYNKLAETEQQLALLVSTFVGQAVLRERQE